jgi:hypothetical protein
VFYIHTGKVKGKRSAPAPLRNEKQGIPEHVPHPPFYFDYVETNVPNAITFRSEQYSFIHRVLDVILEFDLGMKELDVSPAFLSWGRLAPPDLTEDSTDLLG